jgi:uncharacterized protein (DUF3820 family)
VLCDHCDAILQKNRQQAKNVVCDHIESDHVDMRKQEIRFENSRTVMPFGKHNGKPLRMVVESDPDYFKWVLGLDNVDSEFKKIIDAYM